MKNRRLAPETVITVLGSGDETHRRDHREIAEPFRGSCFEVRYYEVMNRAGNCLLGLRPSAPRQRLCGCGAYLTARRYREEATAAALLAVFRPLPA